MIFSKKINNSVDDEFVNHVLPVSERKSTITVLMIMLGFTFFSGSMWAGKEIAEGISFDGFIWSILIGGIILSVYTGFLAWISASCGMGVDLLAKKALGNKGSYLVSFVISFTQIGWFGVGIAMFAIPVANVFWNGNTVAQWILVILSGALMTASAYFGIKSLTLVSYISVPVISILGIYAMYKASDFGSSSLIEQFSLHDNTLGIGAASSLVIGSFISGGTTTPNFARYAKDAKSGAITTIIAFLLGNSLMIIFGGVSSVYVGGNDIFDVMIKLNMFYFALLVLGLNIWTTNDNALYSAGLGLANILKKPKKLMILISGLFGTIMSIWLYWNFSGWLSILNCALPPCGAVIIVSYLTNKENYSDTNINQDINWFGVIGIVLGAIIANIVKIGFPSLNSMIIALIFYIVGNQFKKKKSQRN